MNPAEYHALARKIQDGRGTDDSDVHVAILSSNSLEFLNSFLIVEAAQRALSLSTYFSPFGQIEQVLLDSAVHWGKDPDVIVISLQIEDQMPDAFFRSRRKNGESLKSACDQCVDRLVQCVDMIRRTSKAHILISNFSVPIDENCSPLFDANDVDGCSHAVAKANFDIALAIGEMPGVTVWDYAGLVHANGGSTWTDRRLWQVARQAISASNRPKTAAHLIATISALLSPRSKCLVLDLDNTLWEGTAGDDGMEGIGLGDDYPGLAFKRFQQAVLALSDRGILLAICSKNDEEVARRIFDGHPEMQLQWDDFVATKINWSPKSENLASIAAELNIGLDSLVFFDDNPVEREEVRINAPQVNVIDVPATPIDYISALYSSGLFESPDLSSDDLERVDYYRNEKKRKSHASSYRSVDEFLTSLEMTAALGCVNDKTIGRASQLIAKTNQFNLTTRRHNQTQIETMSNSEQTDVRWIRIADRFGDNGIVGITVTEYQDDTARVDSFVMSCRVMNRHVEDAMLADILTRAKHRNMKRVIGEYLPTDRNAIVKDFYKARKFQAAADRNGSGLTFEFDLDNSESIVTWPETISIKKHNPE